MEAIDQQVHLGVIAGNGPIVDGAGPALEPAPHLLLQPRPVAPRQQGEGRWGLGQAVKFSLSRLQGRLANPGWGNAVATLESLA